MPIPVDQRQHQARELRVNGVEKTVSREVSVAKPGQVPVGDRRPRGGEVKRDPPLRGGDETLDRSGLAAREREPRKRRSREAYVPRGAGQGGLDGDTAHL